MDILYKNQIEFLLKRETGIKACLFDEESKTVISSLIPYSQFLDNDYFYFDYLTNKNRTPLSDVSCVVVIRPTSLKPLIEELANPYYGNYVILFTNQIDPFALEILANADIKSSISEIHEIYIDSYKQDAFLYTIGSTSQRRVSDSLFSLLMSLEITPNIKIHEFNHEESSGFREIGRELQMKSLQYNFKKKGCIILLKRNFDLISPLICDWHYQALIQEYCELNHGAVKIDNKSYVLNDAFFFKNKFNDIHQVGDEIKNVVKELEINKIKINNHEFEDIEEKATHSMMAEAHLKIYNKILQECMSIKELSEIEMELIREQGLGLDKALENMSSVYSKDKNYSDFALKLILLSFLRSETDWSEASQKYPKFREYLMKFKTIYKPRNFPYKPRFDLAKDIKLSYESPLKRMIKHIHHDRVKTDVFKSLSSDNEIVEPIIIYIEGGITMGEYRDAMRYANANNIDVYLITDKIISAKDIINNIKSSSNEL